MSASSGENLRRLEAELRGLERAHTDLDLAEDDVDAHLAWANFVRHLKLSLSLLVRFGKADSSTKAEAYRFKNFSTNNELVEFMVKSRNDIDHPEDEEKRDLISGKLRKPGIALGLDGERSLFCIEGNPSAIIDLVIKDCGIGDKRFDGTVSFDPSRAPIVSGISNRSISKAFVIKPVRTQRGELVPVPTKRGTSDAASAEEIATEGRNWLRVGCEKLLPKSVRGNFLKIIDGKRPT